jgi:hypothetical protein
MWEVMRHVAVNEELVGVDWMQIGDAGDELAELAVRECEDMRILSLEEQKFHRVVAIYTCHLKCEKCSKWLAAPLTNVSTVKPTSLCQCTLCGHEQEVNIRSSPPHPSVFDLHIPSYVSLSEVCIVPVKLSGDGFQVFSSVGCELDGFDWVPLNLSVAMTQTVRNSFSFAAFQSTLTQAEKSTMIAKIFAHCEKGFWAWNIASNKFVWVIMCIAFVCADMPGAAKLSGLLDPSKANACSRLTLMHRNDMLDLQQLLAAAPRSRLTEETIRHEASAMSNKGDRKKLLSEYGLASSASPLLALRSMHDMSRAVYALLLACLESRGVSCHDNYNCSIYEQDMVECCCSGYRQQQNALSVSRKPVS